MGFSVLKDPADPRNFIIGPAPGQTAPLDPALIQQGLAAGAVQGMLNRPAPRQFGAGEELTDEQVAARFGGPGDPRQFRRGLVNFEGRLLRKTFEQDKAFFEASVERAGLPLNTPGLQEDLNRAYISTGGFEAAKEVVQQYLFNSPQQVAQRAADLEAAQRTQELQARNLELTNQQLTDKNATHKITLGVPMERYTEDRTKYFRNAMLAKEVQDLMVLHDQWGVMRDPFVWTDADRAAVQTAYEVKADRLALETSQAFQAGALTEGEWERFRSFFPFFGKLAHPQDSVRRVQLGNAMNIFAGAADNIWQGNIGLQRGSEAVNWDSALGAPRGWKEIIFLESPQEGDRTITTDELPAVREELAGPQRLPRPERPQLEEIPISTTENLPSSEVSATPGADFFQGLEDIIGGAITQEIERSREGFRAEEERKRRAREAGGR